MIRLFFLFPALAFSVVIESFDFEDKPMDELKFSQAPEIDYSQALVFESVHEIETPVRSKPTISNSQDINLSTSSVFNEDQLLALTQSINALSESLETLDKAHQQLHSKIEGLESHQREFMGYIHDKFLASSTTQTTDAQEQDYEYGLTLMKQNKMEVALTHWQEFIDKHGDTSKAPAAYYWIGEIYYVLQQDDFAKDSYMYLINNYPENEKSPDAMYKIGQIFYNQGSQKNAEKYWQMIIETHPKSSVSKLAKQQLSEVRS